VYGLLKAEVNSFLARRDVSGWLLLPLLKCTRKYIVQMIDMEELPRVHWLRSAYTAIRIYGTLLIRERVVSLSELGSMKGPGCYYKGLVLGTESYGLLSKCAICGVHPRYVFRQYLHN
jgi:hypothetical protein